ncbi:MAG: PolC-type DNA polymerase III [Oscillospiraceae bacterium]|nr:PolC-type DNA polymerase III [Oscillospiraceae bacterium]MBP3521651.1 PolC-type DNA polymerase III [Oscillospiraceae bacterium]
MLKQVPFIKLFAAFPQAGPLGEMVAPWMVTGAVIDKKSRSIRAQILCPVFPSEKGKREAETILGMAYSVERVELEMELIPPTVLPFEDIPLPEPPGEEAVSPEWMEDPPLPEPPDGEDMSLRERPMGIEEDRLTDQEERRPVDVTPASEAMDPFRITEELRRKAIQDFGMVRTAAKPAEKKKTKLLMGKREIKGAPIPMSQLELDMGTVVIEGDVFETDHRETKRRKGWVVRFAVTDYTNSIQVNKFFPDEEGKSLVDGLQVGQHLLIQGQPNLDKYTHELVFEPYAIQVGEKTVRKDTAQEKRVELHLHTTMSAMDALTPAGEAVKRAESWGHRAIAITDHAVAQAFPEAWHVAKDIKVLYGVEAYFINNMDDRVAIHGQSSQDFHGEIVCFDIETTGLNKNQDKIIEIGAVILRDGEVRETFNTFVSPGRSLPREIIELTGITDKMLEGAPSQAEAVNAFLDFAGDRPLAAHNAEFDVGFISLACKQMGRELPNPWIDSLILSQNLLPDLKNFKLDTVANRLNLPFFNHHRASDDAATVGYMLIPFFKRLEEMGVHDLQSINSAMVALRGNGKTRRQPKHLIILAKNQMGLRNLYRLISDSFLVNFKSGKALILKSEIEAHREGLIIGSACEAGELYRAVAAGKSWEELKRIASWYDFLEIQPLCNNAFMLRPEKKTGRPQAENEEELKEFNRTIVALGKELDKPVCATGDVHFLDPKDELYRHILLDSKGFEDCDQPLPIYFKTTDEMLEEFSYLGKEDCHKVVIEDPNLIADMCERIKPLPKGLFAPKLENSAQELEKLVYDKAHELYGEELPQVVQDRIDLELPGIIMRKYDVIYMSAQKLVQNSLEHGYLVGSRGSVGSSIVAFLSGITEVNSLPPHYRCPKCRHSDFNVDKKYGCGADMPDAVCPVCGTPYVKDGFDIPFETFLGFGGDKVPDIDLNFSDEYQSKAHRYTFELFGESHVFRAGTIGTVAEKTAYGYVKKYLEKREIRATGAEENRLAKGCTGTRRTSGQHPGGMVVIPQDREIYDFCPVQHPADDPNSEIVTTHFEYHSMESNLLKLDMLGHQDPTMIRMLEDLTGVNARTDIKLDDPDTMSLFTSSEKLGYMDDPVLGPTGAVAIPEFNTKFTRQMLMDTEPTDFNTLVRLSGFSHGTDVWLGNARDLILSGTASVLETVGCRDDIMLYLIQMGVEPKTAFKIMEAVRKGKVRKAGFQDGWVETMKEHGVPDWYIESLAKISYLFPKAHAVAYVMMGFRIAWFKVHRPLEFYAAYFSIRAKAFDATIMCQGMDLVKAKMKEIKDKMEEKQASAVEEDTYTTLEVVYEFYLRGLTFGHVDLYRSEATHFVRDGEDALIPPFVSIPGLGETAAQSIVEQRKGREFISIDEFSDACPKVSKTHIELLKATGAFGDMPDTSQITLF